VTGTEVSIRSYRPEDEGGVLDLLSTSLGAGPTGKRTAEFFRWKHLQNPFGVSYLLVGEVAGQLAGLRALMRWEFKVGDRTFHAVRAVDTATHPAYRGQGVFSALTLSALESLGGDVDFVFNTPNRASGAGYLKMGWRVAGRPRVGIRIRRPLRFVWWFRYSGQAPSGPPPTVAAETAADVLADGDAVAALLEEADEPSSSLHTPRSVDFLRWRYADVPGLAYHAVREGSSGLLLFRVRRRGRLTECSIADVAVRRGDSGTAGRLLARALRSAPVDHATCLLPAGSAFRRAAFSRGFLRSGSLGARGVLLMVRPMQDGLRPDPTDMRSWGFSLGDLEVF
jgi:GNAT superfamily N-acetyltransferase